MQAEFPAQHQIELVEQIVLRLEIRKQRSLGDPRRLGDCRGRSPANSPFRTDAQSRIENCLLLITTPRSSQRLSPYSVPIAECLLTHILFQVVRRLQARPLRKTDFLPLLPS